MISKEIAIQALTSIKDAGSGKSVIELGWINEVRVNPPRAIIRLTLPHFAQSQRVTIAEKAKQLLNNLEGITNVQIEIGELQKQNNEANSNQENRISLQAVPGIKRVIAISSGKGGVGKSTVAVNLACALANKGFKVGLLDADIYGPNTPIMLGVSNKTPEVSGEGTTQKITPIDNYGVAMISMGLLIEESQPVIWRGPMLNGIIRQFLYQASWGERDFLIVDLPPGTGDAQLSLAQSVPMTGVVIVTTPQEVSLQDSRRGLAMFKQMNIPILGVVENMTAFIPPDQPTKRYCLFGSGGGKKLATENSVPLLAQIPLEITLDNNNKENLPIVIGNPNSISALQFNAIANSIIGSEDK